MSNVELSDPTLGSKIKNRLKAFADAHPDEDEERIDAPAELAPDAPAVDQPIEAPPAPDQAPPAEQSAPQEPAPVVEDFEEFEIDDPVANAKYVVRTKKEYAQSVRDGWMRRDDYSRKTAKLSKHRALLEPMIESGVFDTIAPLIQDASTSQELADALTHIYRQYQARQPLVYTPQGYQPQVQVQPSQQVQQYQQYQQQEVEDPETDPYTAQAVQYAVQRAVGPISQQQQEIQRYIQSQQEAQRLQEENQRIFQAKQRQETQQWQEAHYALQQNFPGEFDGTGNDLPKLRELDTIAKNSGFSPETHGYVGRLIAARNLRGQSYAPIQSQAASSLAQAQEFAREQTKLASASVANSTGAGRPIAASPPQRISYRDKEGKPLSMKDAIRIAQRNAELGG